MTTARTLDEIPGLTALYGRTLGSVLPGPFGSRRAPTGSTPDPVRVSGVGLDAGRLRSYRKVCAFPDSGVPATFPQVVAFPLHLLMMTDESFPFAPFGVVHVRNEIRQVRPLDENERLDLVVSCTPPSPHPRGRQLSLLTEAQVDGEKVWTSAATVLSRGAGESAGDHPADTAVPDAAPDGPQVWRLPADLGRRYAGVSGDRNPIHLFDLTAKPFGFSRHIAHGMWTKARCLAELHNRLPDSFDVTVSFRRPVTLPGAIRFGARTVGSSTDFGVSSPTSGSTHLLGRVAPLGAGR